MEDVQVKKIFILTGEPSGDKLASKVIQEFKKDNAKIEYLSVGGENLKALGIKSIYDLKDITYIGFTNVFKNIFKINKKINETVKAIQNFNPDILFGLSIKELTALNKSFGLHFFWSSSGIISFPAAILIILANLTFTKDLTIK